MLFEPAHYGTKLKVINPEATLAVITLWSRTETICSRLEGAGIDLHSSQSKVAVVGNLYGEGFRYLLRNLLYNPQIDSLLIIGRDSSGSSSYPMNFFSKGVEPVDHDITYKASSGAKKVGAVRVIDTEHVMDDLVTPDKFQNRLSVFHAGGMDTESIQKAADYLNGYNSKGWTGPRVDIEVPEVEMSHFPSNVRDHTIIGETPSEAWKYLVHRIFRFGREVEIAKGKRRELQNVKVVIEKPVFEDAATINECGFSPDSFAEYQRTMLSKDLPSDKTYTYGYRLRSHFGSDSLDNIADNLKEGLDDRRCYATTWDNTTDVTGNSRPCLASLFFRKDGHTLYLTATFRTHNASSAWYENIYGLMAYQQYVCERAKLDPGAITVISHSISLDPSYIEKAQIIHDKIAKTNIERRDPNGHFTITIDDGQIIVAHWLGSAIINEYKAGKPEKLQHMLYRDCAISDINHALYIGRQLEKAYQCIQAGTTYVEA